MYPIEDIAAPYLEQRVHSSHVNPAYLMTSMELFAF
jgi:hypothetical protein